MLALTSSLCVFQEQENFQSEIQKAQTKLLQLSRDKRYF